MATYKIQHRNDTTSNWNTHNPVLLKGEIGIEFQASNTVAWKIGDGVTQWRNLSYSSGPQGPQGTSGFKAPRKPFVDYNGSVPYTVPSDGWIHARGTSTGAMLMVALVNTTTDIQTHCAVFANNLTASVTMPVRAGDVMAPTVTVGELNNPFCRFYPGN